MDYLEFIARTTSHIPDKGQVTVRYFGLSANAHRGKLRKAGPAAIPPDYGGGAPASPGQRLGRDHPQGLRGFADALPSMRRIDKG